MVFITVRVGGRALLHGTDTWRFFSAFSFFWCTNFAATPCCYLLFIKTGNLHGELLRVLTKKNFFSETFLLCNARWPWESNDEGSALTLSGDLSGQGQSPASPPSHEPFHHRQWPVRPLVGLQTARGGFIFQDQTSLSQVWSPPQFWVFYKQGSLIKFVGFFYKNTKVSVCCSWPPWTWTHLVRYAGGCLSLCITVIPKEMNKASLRALEGTRLPKKSFKGQRLT